MDDASANEQLRRNLFKAHQEQAWSDRQSSSDEYDKAVIAISSGGLVLSVAFIEKVAPLQTALATTWLTASWIAFVVSIFCVVLSFRLSILATDRHVEHLQQYYLNNHPEYLNKSNPFAKAVELFNWASGLCLVFAMAATVVFACHNIKTEKSVSENKGSTPVNLQEGRTPVAMTPCVPIDHPKGRTPVAMTPVPDTTPATAVTPAPPSAAHPATQPTSTPAANAGK
jgi:hypothetical protein